MSAQSLVLIGSTGLVGKEILKNLNTQPEIATKVYSLTRREVPNFKANSHVEQVIEKDNSKWTELLLKIPNLHTLVSSLGSTKAAAGGFENQYKIDHDLNLEMAKTAKLQGCDTYVIVSSIGSSPGSRFPYLKMKGELEEDVKALKFNKTIILRPGALLGAREREKSIGGQALTMVAGFVKNVSGYRFVGSISGEEMGKAVAEILKESVNYKDGTVKTFSPSELLAFAKKA